MSTAQALSSAETASRVVMRDVPWETYISLTEIESRHTRIAYDEGVMEIMSPMRAHERIGRLIGRMVEIWTIEKGLEIQSVKSTTFQDGKLSKGFEADESYYIQHAEDVRQTDGVDLTIHPGPDLVIEVDISSSSMSKFGIYASLRVAEVWRWEEGQIQIYHHTDEQTAIHGYIEVKNSKVLPGFPFDLAVKLIESRLDRGENQLMREFRNSIIETT